MATRPKLRMLEERYEEICGMIGDGKSQREICTIVGVSGPLLTEFLTHPDRASVIKALEEQVADGYVEEAYRVLNDCPNPDSIAQVNLAKTKSEFLRWKAGVKCPRKYGNKIDVSGEIAVKPKMSSEQLQEFIAKVTQKTIQPPHGEVAGEFIDYDETTD